MQDLDGVPLGAITVSAAYGGSVTVTNPIGAFELPHPVSAGGPAAFVRAASDEYEQGGAGFSHGSSDVELPPLRLQRKVFLDLGDAPVSGTIGASHPGRWTGEEYGSDYCTPCARIRVSSPPRQLATLTLAWTGDVPLQVWVFTQPPGYPSGLVTTAVARAGEGRILLRFEPSGAESAVHVGLPEKNGLRTMISRPVPFTLAITPE